MKAKIRRVSQTQPYDSYKGDFKITFSDIYVKLNGDMVELTGLPEGLDRIEALQMLAWSLKEKSNKNRIHTKTILTAIENELKSRIIIKNS